VIFRYVHNLARRASSELTRLHKNNKDNDTAAAGWGAGGGTATRACANHTHTLAHINPYTPTQWRSFTMKLYTERSSLTGSLAVTFGPLDSFQHHRT
jgi:hypothetical protein